MMLLVGSLISVAIYPAVDFQIYFVAHSVFVVLGGECFSVDTISIFPYFQITSLLQITYFYIVHSIHKCSIMCIYTFFRIYFRFRIFLKTLCLLYYFVVSSEKNHPIKVHDSNKRWKKKQCKW